MRILITFTLLVVATTSCQEKIVIDGTPENVFEVFWNTLNERYVHFPDKDIDWDAVYNEFMPRFREVKTEGELRELFREVLELFRDGHLNISQPIVGTGFQSSIGFANPFPGFPPSLFDVNIERYGFELVTDRSPFRIYQHNSKGYVYISCTSFQIDYNAEWLLTTINDLNYYEGIIIDVSRNNGGKMTNAYTLISLFIDAEDTWYYKQFRSGIEHNKYTNPQKVTISQYRNLPQGWMCFSHFPVVLISGRITYSSGTIFSYIVGELPNVISVGHPSNGGGDFPIIITLPNGWRMRYPYAKLFTRKGLDMHTPFVPDIEIERVANRDTTAVIRTLERLDSLNAYQWINYWEIPPGGTKSYHK